MVYCMRYMHPTVLTLNGGSSSIRFAVFSSSGPPVAVLRGKMDRIGGTDAKMSATRGSAAPLEFSTCSHDRDSAIAYVLDWLEGQPEFASIVAVGHRVVHGMSQCVPQRVTVGLLEELARIVPVDPEHLPSEIALMDAIQRRHPHLPQIVCFDTAFHQSMPRVAAQLSLPRRFEAQGVRRYGFHGLSYTYLMEELRRLGDPAATDGRVILAHLGSGASLAAVRSGISMDTSMGFTPSAGLVMGTRSGDLDPGLMSYLALAEGIDAARFRTIVNHESGLLGISETSADVRDLLEQEFSDRRAAEAIDLFCYQAKKWIGAYAAALGGVDTLVFAGGIGENSASVRARICAGMKFLGIELDEDENARHASQISLGGAPVSVRVIRTDEESVIAAFTIQLLGQSRSGPPI